MVSPDHKGKLITSLAMTWCSREKNQVVFSLFPVVSGDKEKTISTQQQGGYMIDYAKMWSSLRTGETKWFPVLREAMEKKRSRVHPNSIYGMLLRMHPEPQLLVKELRELERWDHEDIPSLLEGIILVIPNRKPVKSRR